MKKACVLVGLTALVIAIGMYAQAPQAPQAPPQGGGQRGVPGTENGIAVFQTQCMSCHGNPNVERAPSPNAIREMSPERIYAALATGVMKDQGDKLSDQDKRGVSEFMSGRPMGSAQQGEARNMPNQCRNNPAMADPARGPSWNGWSADVSNSRFQSAQVARLTAADVPRPEARSEPVPLPRARPQAAGSRADPIADIINPSRQLSTLQRVLNDFGYGPIKVTGTLDEDTSRGIEQFERDHNLAVTGQNTPQLRRALGLVTGRPLD